MCIVKARSARLGSRHERGKQGNLWKKIHMIGDRSGVLGPYQSSSSLRHSLSPYDACAFLVPCTPSPSPCANGITNGPFKGTDSATNEALSVPMSPVINPSPVKIDAVEQGGGERGRAGLRTGDAEDG